MLMHSEASFKLFGVSWVHLAHLADLVSDDPYSTQRNRRSQWY